MSEDEAVSKGAGELAYWSQRKDAEGKLENSWFERFYTDHFGLTHDDYRAKRVLDIGCGPRGSLEWATMARERVGVDPLADHYLEMGAAEHAMTYVASGAETVPYPDASFDIVCSFNSLDHVDDLEAAIAEMKRLAAPGGLLLVITDVHDRPTPQEPICFDWDVIELFAPEFAIQSFRCLEKFGNGAYQSAEQGIFFDHANTQRRYGVLTARFVRVVETQPESLEARTEPESQFEAAEDAAPLEPTFGEAATQLATAAMRTIRDGSEQMVERVVQARRDRRR